MMRRLLPLLLVLTAMPVMGKSVPTAKKRMEQLRRDMDRYAQLDIHDQEGIGDLQERIFSRCLSLLNTAPSGQLHLNRELGHQAMQVTGSEDGRLWLLSLDQRTGGTFRERRTMAQLRTPDGRVRAFALGDTELDGYASCDLSLAWFDDIQALDDSTYFTVASIIGCSTCIDLCAVTLRVRDLELEAGTFFSYGGRMGLVSTFDLDPATATFTYAYELIEDDPLYPMEGLPRHAGSFRYLAGHFQEQTRCESR
jgi:hypothetical protein